MRSLAIAKRLLTLEQGNPDDSYSTATAPPVSSLDKATFGVALSLHAIVVVLCLVMLGLCIWKRKKQPLKSRKWVPYVFLVSKILSQVAVVQSAWPAGWNSYDLGVNAIVGCYIQLWGTNPLYIINMLCVIFMFCRFFLLRAYEKRKIAHQDLKRNNASMRTLTKSHKISKAVKFSTSFLTLFFAIVISTLSIYIIGAIDVSRTNGTCSDSWAKYTANGVPAAILARYEIFVVVIIALVGIIAVILDLIFNGHFRTCFRCKETPRAFFKNLFMEDDPLRYRMELYLFAFPAVSLGIIVGAFGIVSTVTTRADYVVLVRNILYVFFWDIPGILVIPGVVLFTAIAWERREKRDRNLINIGYELPQMSPGGKEIEVFESGGVRVSMPRQVRELDITEFNDSENMINRILGCGDYEAYKLFKDFTSKEFSVENVLIYDDILTYKSYEFQDELYKQCKYIFESYLETNSLSEVNIPRKYIEQTREIVKEYEANPTEHILDPGLFDKILEEVIMNLKDSYMRLWYTDAWKQFIAKRKQQQKV